MREAGRRPHHQLQRLVREKRPSALSRLSCRTTSRRQASIALTEALALELAADNILVNAIAPGPILAPPGTTDEEAKRRRTGHAAGPLGRRRRNRESGARPSRQRFHHRRNHARRRRQASGVDMATLKGRRWSALRRQPHRKQRSHRFQRAGQLLALAREAETHVALAVRSEVDAGTQPIRPCLMRYSVIATTATGAPMRAGGPRRVDLKERVEGAGRWPPESTPPAISSMPA